MHARMNQDARLTSSNHAARRSEAEPHWYGSRHSLADQGDFDVAGESCALVEPAGAGLVAAASRRASALAGRAGLGGEGGEQARDLGDGQRDHAGIGGRRLIGPDGRRCLGIGAVLSRAAVTAQMARAAMTSTVCRAIAV